MARLFSDNYDSDKVRFDLVKIEPKKLLFVAFEGVVTEPDYFNKLSQYVKDSKKYSVKIFPVDRKKEDGKSHPNHVRDGLYEYYNEELKSFFNVKKDELWIVIDIDQHFSSTRDKSSEIIFNEFNQSLEEIDSVKIKAAISNPSFELWLLLHFLNANEIDLIKIKENRKISKKKTYIKKYLEECINQRRSNGESTVYQELTDIALENSVSELLTDENVNLLNSVGTSLNKLLMIVLDK